MLSSGGICYHLGQECYHQGVGVIICVAHVIIWGKMLSSGIGVLSSGG